MPETRKLNREERKRYLNLRRRFPKPVIGITGNLGKSSTLEMINTVLATRGKVLKDSRGHGNWRNNIRLLEKLSPDYDYALFEFDYQRGNHFAEILRLIKPTIGILTNIGDAHLNYLGTMMQIVLEKSAVVKYLARDGLAILNKDDELSSALGDFITTTNIIKFGLSQSSDYYASDIQQLGPEGVRFKLNGKYPVKLPIYSIQDVYNFLAAVACTEYLGFKKSEIIDIFQERFVLSPGRGKLHRFGDVIVLDESYIGTPRSLSKAARSLIGFRPYSENLCLVVGDMTGAGVKVEEQHLNMGYFISALPISNIITIGEYAKFIAKGASLIKTNHKRIHSVNTIDELLDHLKDQLSDKSVISVKGVGSVAMHRILKFVGQRFDSNGTRGEA